MTDVQLLRIPEAGRTLGLGRSSVYKLIESGELRVIRLGGAVRVPTSEVAALIARRLAAQQVA